MSITSDVQKLEPGNRIQLIEVDGSKFGGPVLRFHAYNIPHTPEEIDTAGETIESKSIWWQGNEYSTWPYEIEGIAKNSDGSPARPTLRVGNIDSVISALCLEFDDMVQAKITIYDTFSHYLDAVNFPDGNETANPDECFKQVFYIDKKSTEIAGESIEFELASPFDLQGVSIPARQIHNLCEWSLRGWYRTGNGCSYCGTKYFDKNGNQVDDPALDMCGGLTTDCKKRFGEDEPNDFGGFPASGLT